MNLDEKNALAAELEDFILAVNKSRVTGQLCDAKVPGEAGLRALRLAIAIENEARRYNDQYGFKFAQCTPERAELTVLSALSIPSRSKINLYLKVLKRRPDRYHELETLFLPLDTPADRVTLDFVDTPGIRVCSSLAGLPENLENLAGRAALAYADMAGIAPAWSIRIEKEIPVAAGMGGGSSNAAAVLRLLNRHYGKLSSEELADLRSHSGRMCRFSCTGAPPQQPASGRCFTIRPGSCTPRRFSS